MKALIIEQEKIIAQSLSYFMEQNQFDVLLANSRQEGISQFKKNPCDLVLCGDRLPDGNGLDVLKEFLKENPRLVSILMTVRNEESLRQDAMEAGVRGYLVKPFDLKQLEEALSNADCGMRIAE
jgi:two-component system, NtrC family, response regulator AtoC